MEQQINRTDDLNVLLSAYLPDRIRKAVKGIKDNYINGLEEIRIRSGLPLMGVFSGNDYFISEEEFVTRQSALNITAKVNSYFFFYVSSQYMLTRTKS